MAQTAAVLRQILLGRWSSASDVELGRAMIVFWSVLHPHPEPEMLDSCVEARAHLANRLLSLGYPSQVLLRVFLLQAGELNTVESAR